MAGDANSAPDWLSAGQDVVHTTFGSGTVCRIGEYKQEPTVWIDFDFGSGRLCRCGTGFLIWPAGVDGRARRRRIRRFAATCAGRGRWS